MLWGVKMGAHAGKPIKKKRHVAKMQHGLHEAWQD